jgi:hypothetical protein
MVLKFNDFINESFKKGQDITYTDSEPVETYKHIPGNKGKGEEVIIKKGDKGTIVYHNAGKNYQVDFFGVKLFMDDTKFK